MVGRPTEEENRKYISYKGRLCEKRKTRGKKEPYFLNSGAIQKTMINCLFPITIGTAIGGNVPPLVQRIMNFNALKGNDPE